MIDKKQLRQLVREVLEGINLHSIDAENLVLGTIAQESLFGTYLKQVRGPAKGITQVEPATHDDIVNNFLVNHPELAIRIKNVCGVSSLECRHLVYNLAYSIAICRIFYYRKPGVLPSTIDGMAKYWKKHYNTELGAGTVTKFIDNYKKYVL